MSAIASITPSKAVRASNWQYRKKLLSSGHDYVLTPYRPHSWWHELGRGKMVKRLQARGFPHLFGWLFVTLTVDPEMFGSETEAFEKGRDRIRRAVARLRERHDIKRYFVKFELTEAGWPHWHLGLDCKEFIENEHLEEVWGYGFTKIKRVSKPRDFKYLFKYVTKDATGDGVPDWVLDYPKTIRVFQTSSGFFGDTNQAKSRVEPEQRERTSNTLRAKWLVWLKRGLIRGRAVGTYGVSVHLADTFTEIFFRQVDLGQRPMDLYHMPVSKDVIQQIVIQNEHRNPDQSTNTIGYCFFREDGRFEKVLPRAVA
ncbi:rolling circle replication-associated protein [Oleiharenicola lentus]|uniref:rolling circle replication-associated protein n=1 Tax=Oleiharenicola lentus TaxID=2508720 RepID=UPI003F665B82